MLRHAVVTASEVHMAHEAAAAASAAVGRAGQAVTSAAGRDIKAEADLMAEAAMLDVLRSGGLPVLSEEQGADDDFSMDADGWIIDPLDGTMNFVRGIPVACSCVALWRGGAPVYGVIVEHGRDVVWAGGEGHPATCNAALCACSNAADPAQAMLATGFPRCFDFEGPGFLATMGRLSAYKKVRMIGCAGLSLAWTAGGMMDIYLEDAIFVWDVAAGLAILGAAGGAWKWTQPDSRHLTSVAAGSQALVDLEWSNRT